MSYLIDIQNVCQAPLPVSEEQLRDWVIHVLSPFCQTGELTLRLVDEDEIIHLNHIYRKINKKTNVLAFKSTYPQHVILEYPLLGDVIICPSVLKEESLLFKKQLIAHWAHIVIHGVLHLLGYDHIKEQDEKIMQSIEIKLLFELNFGNPYQEDESIE